MPGNDIYNEISHISSIEEAVKFVYSHPEWRDTFRRLYPNFDKVYALYESQLSYEQGKIDANDLLGAIGQYAPGANTQMSPETEKWLDNQIARENTQQQQGYELQARDTSLLSSGSQLQALGLSPSSVIQTGGASAGVQGSTAETSMRSNSALRQQMKINKFNQTMGLAKSLIGAAGSMASSGIYGHALGAIKKSVQTIGAAAAHSAYGAMHAGMKLGDFKDSLGPSKLGMQVNPHQIPTGMNWQADWDDMMNDLGY